MGQLVHKYQSFILYSAHSNCRQRFCFVLAISYLSSWYSLEIVMKTPLLHPMANCCLYVSVNNTLSSLARLTNDHRQTTLNQKYHLNWKRQQICWITSYLATDPKFHNKTHNTKKTKKKKKPSKILLFQSPWSRRWCRWQVTPKTVKMSNNSGSGHNLCTAYC